jgi:hypothetical protein
VEFVLFLVVTINNANNQTANQTNNKQAELANAILMTEDKSALVQFTPLLWLVVEFVLSLVLEEIAPQILPLLTPPQPLLLLQLLLPGLSQSL